MPPNTKALLAFAGRFLFVFVLTLPLWFAVTPGYNRLLSAGGNMLLAVTEHPRTHRLVGWKRDILIVRADTPIREGMKLQGFTGYLTHFNLVLMTGLILASRLVAWRRRCIMLAIALTIMLLIHIVYLVIGVKFFEQPELEAFQGAAGRLYVWGVNFYLSIAAQLVPVLIWMLLYRTFSGIPDDARAVNERSVSGPSGKTSGRRKATRAP